MTLAEQIKEIAYPIAIGIFFVIQKLDMLRAERAREAQRLATEHAAAAQKLATESAAAVLQIKIAEQNATALRAAEEVKQHLAESAAEVKRKLDEQALEVKRKLEIDSSANRLKMEEIHIDVNSKMAAQKKKTWQFALMLARRADATPADHAAARDAEKDYLDHVEAQNRADERVRLFVASQVTVHLPNAT